MPFHQEWLIPERIVKVSFWGNLTVEEIANSFKVSGKFLMESQATRVHFVHDWSRLKTFPTNLSQIRNATNFGENPAMNKLGWVVVYGVKQKLLRFIGDLTFQLFQIRTHMTDDFDSALKFLHQQDATLVSEKKSTDVSWYLKGHILYCYDVITDEDMTLRNQNALNLIEQDGKPPYVHMLIDFSSTASDTYESDVRDLVRRSLSSKEFADARDNLIRHPLFGWVVVFQVHNRNINVGGKIVAMKYNYKRKEVATLTEAVEFLKQIDPHVASLLQLQSSPNT